MACPSLSDLPPPPRGRTGWPWTEGSPPVPATMPDGRPWPRVSVVTPSYNQAQFIEETIRSVLLQGYPNLEYIIIDGGSTDGSVDIIRRYEPWLAYWVSERDKGQSDALNKGLRHATGEIVGWLNSDDTYCPGAVQYAAEYLAANFSLAAVYGDCNRIDENGANRGVLIGNDFSLRSLVLGNFIPQPTVFVRRHVLEELAGWDRELHFVMDYDLWLRIGLCGYTMRYVPGTSANFRLHGRSKTVSQSSKFFNEIEISLERLFADSRMPEDLRPLKEKAIALVYLRAACSAYWERLIAEGQRNLARAIELHRDILEDYDQVMRALMSSVAGEKYAISYLQFFFDHLPETARPLIRMRNKALSDIWVQQAFRAFWDGDHATVCRVLARAIVCRPAWLRNRGVWSIFVRSLLRRKASCPKSA